MLSSVLPAAACFYPAYECRWDRHSWCDRRRLKGNNNRHVRNTPSSIASTTALSSPRTKDCLSSPSSLEILKVARNRFNEEVSFRNKDKDISLAKVIVNLAGLPALVVPCGFVEGGPDGLPVGLQMIGAAYSEIIGVSKQLGGRLLA